MRVTRGRAGSRHRRADRSAPTSAISNAISKFDTRRDGKSLRRQNGQCAHSGEITIMSDQCIGIDGKRTGGLDGIGEFEPQRGPQAGGALCQATSQVNYLPRFQDSAIAFRQRLAVRLQRTGENFCDRYGRDRKVQISIGLPLKHCAEYICEFRMCLEKVNNWRGVHEDE